ncbi:MAG: hypothetical protein DHS80DRAFT_25203 [Piptocephalis tieghemiana]|nr:MAG: hypothetical protein DHS80DRAFT_25203 [Piptocephalis tieghemiana]
MHVFLRTFLSLMAILALFLLSSATLSQAAPVGDNSKAQSGASKYPLLEKLANGRKVDSPPEPSKPKIRKIPSIAVGGHPMVRSGPKLKIGVSDAINSPKGPSGSNSK